MRARADAAREKAQQLLAQPNLTRTDIESFRTEQMALADTFTKRVAQALGDASEVLTADQRKKLGELIDAPPRARGWWHRGQRSRLVDVVAAMRLRRILLVEDDPVLAEMVKSYLGGAGFDVTVAPTGAAGLNLHKREAVDAIILDLMLPDMDGLDVCRKLRLSRKRRC